MRPKMIAIEGLIGSGKSSLTRELGPALGKNTLVLMEPDEKDNANPYLADYYTDGPRWAAIMQTHLLS
jgi:deoxyadenosine/deoxycytidine kinase